VNPNADVKPRIVFDGKPWNVSRVDAQAHALLVVGTNQALYFSLARTPIGPFTSKVVIVEYLDGKEGNWFSIEAKTKGEFRKIETDKRGNGLLVSFDVTTVVKLDKTGATKTVEAHFDDVHVNQLLDGPVYRFK
jgi:hypothetical protein